MDHSNRAFPLCWPDDVGRTPSGRRKNSSPFKVTEHVARQELIRSLRLLGASNVVLSTNLQPRRDGKPTLSVGEMADPGVVVYFDIFGHQSAIACDVYTKIGWNYRALGLAIDGMRAIGRSGASDIMKRAFSGFAALPARASESSWMDILGPPPGTVLTADWVNQRFKELAKRMHPDNGGSQQEFVRLTLARDSALSEASAGFARQLVR